MHGEPREEVKPNREGIAEVDRLRTMQGRGWRSFAAADSITRLKADSITLKAEEELWLFV